MAKDQKFPRLVMVLRRPFVVRYEKNLSTNSGVVGLCGPDTQEILIDSDLGYETEQDTVLHELMHGIWNQTALSKAYDEKQEEQVIYALAPLVLMLFQDNPELVSYLIGQKR